MSPMGLLRVGRVRRTNDSVATTPSRGGGAAEGAGLRAVSPPLRIPPAGGVRVPGQEGAQALPQELASPVARGGVSSPSGLVGPGLRSRPSSPSPSCLSPSASALGADPQEAACSLGTAAVRGGGRWSMVDARSRQRQMGGARTSPAGAKGRETSSMCSPPPFPALPSSRPACLPWAGATGRARRARAPVGERGACSRQRCGWMSKTSRSHRRWWRRRRGVCSLTDGGLMLGAALGAGRGQEPSGTKSGRSHRQADTSRRRQRRRAGQGRAAPSRSARPPRQAHVADGPPCGERQEGALGKGHRGSQV